MCVSCINLPGKETVKAVLFSIFFGMILPSVDAGSDIRLAIRLYLNGHPKWALSVLTPVFVNTFFTMISCREMEKRKSGSCWFMFLPLVFLQIYPQFCICRLLLKFWRGKINLEEFISARDSMEGGVGCVEPYCESVPQVYIQTALFAFVHNINPLLKKLCYQEKEPSCVEFDTCDHYNCDVDPYARGYKRFNSIMNSSINAENCTTDFETCIQNFLGCIDVRCKQNLTSYISELNDDQLYYDVNQETLNPNHTLVQQFGANLGDLKQIQMHRLVIGNSELFISTYLISIFAAAYGVSKFFRLGQARIAKQIFAKKFIFVLIVTVTSLVWKGVVLAAIVMGHESSLFESTLWWILFTKVPSMILVLVFTIILPCVRLYQKCGNVRLNAVKDILLKQPCFIFAPHFTPFFFTLGDIKFADTEPAEIVNGKNMKHLSCIGNYELSGKYTSINAITALAFSIVVFAWKGQWITSVPQILMCVFGALCLCVFFLFWGFYVDEDIESATECVKHDLDNCIDCTKLYGFYSEGYNPFEACEEHEEKKPYEYNVELKNCEKCKDIKLRYVS